MRHIPCFLFFVGSVISCAPLHEMNSPEKHLPSLGDIGKYSKSLVHTSFNKIGNPSVNNPIVLSVMEVPFTKSKFRSYSAMKENMGVKSALDFTDSIPNELPRGKPSGYQNNLS